MDVLQKLKIELPYPVIPLLVIYPRKIQILIQKDTCTSVFIAALFTIARIQKLPKYPLEWILRLLNGSLHNTHTHTHTHTHTLYIYTHTHTFYIYIIYIYILYIYIYTHTQYIYIVYI